MPTLAEMELMRRSFGDLADTFQRNRAMASTERERRAREALEREELGLRREESAGARAHRKLTLESQMAHQSRLEALQKEENADKRVKMALDFLADMNKSGQLTVEGIAAMQRNFEESPFGKQLAGAGLGMKLFQKVPTKAPRTPEGYTDPVTKERFVYNPETGAFTRSAKETAGKMRIKPGAFGDAPEVSIERDLSDEDFRLEMEKMQGGAGAPGAGASVEERIRAAKAKQIEREMEEQIKELATGDERTGFLNTSSREEILRELQAKRDKLGAPSAGGAPAAPTPTAAPATTAVPPRPAGKSDAEILREAAAAMEKNPAIAAQVRARLLAWGLLPQ